MGSSLRRGPTARHAPAHHTGVRRATWTPAPDSCTTLAVEIFPSFRRYRRKEGGAVKGARSWGLPQKRKRPIRRGATVGDRFKDISGPSLNTLVELMSMEAIVVPGIAISFSLV